MLKLVVADNIGPVLGGTETGDRAVADGGDRRAPAAAWPGSAPSCSRSRSSRTSAATPTSRAASRTGSATGCRSTSTAPTSRAASATSGGDGTSRCRAGCATTCMSRSAATGISVPRTYVNLMIVMFLGGLWHGAAWTFVVWGLHPRRCAGDRAGAGNGACSGRTSARARSSSSGHVLWFVVVQLTVLVAWVFFRSETFAGAGICSWPTCFHSTFVQSPCAIRQRFRLRCWRPFR